MVLVKYYSNTSENCSVKFYQVLSAFSFQCQCTNVNPLPSHDVTNSILIKTNISERILISTFNSAFFAG